MEYSRPAFGKDDADKDAAYGFDLDRARALLDESGLRDIHVDIAWQAPGAVQATTAQIYQADLDQIGVRATLKPLEPICADRKCG